MPEKITGSYPGGPRRDDTSSQREGPIKTRSVRELEEARAQGMLRKKGQARTRRLLWGILVVVLAAGASGWFLGAREQPTAASLQAEVEMQRRTDMGISQEVNRALLELWRMEDVEAIRNNRR